MKILPFLISCFFLVSCGKPTQRSGLTFSKSSVINGRTLEVQTNFEKSIVKLRAHTLAFTMMGDMRDIKSYCTGTFINPTTVITAAHCLHMKTFLNGYQRVDDIFLDKKVIAPDSIHIHPKYNIEDDFKAPYDVAILKFNQNISLNTLPLSKERPKFNDIIKIYGFGNERGSTATEFKSYGQNYLSTKNHFKILSGDPDKVERAKRLLPKHGLDKKSLSYIGTRVYNNPKYPSGSNVSSEKGDSGGPILINGKLSGIISGGVNLREPTKSRLNFGVDLSQPEIKVFLKAYID